MNAKQGPFSGIRVLEFGQYVAVPYCAELFAHGGAEVIKVEPIGGDATRGNSAIIPGEGRQYIIKNRGKQGIPMDLGSAEGRAVARRIALSCDVVLSNMRPGLLERLGLDYASLSAEEPRIIFGEISGFGREGPFGDKAALDLVVQAASGLMISGRGFQGARPLGSEAFLTDYTSAALLAFAVASALFVRERTGRGQYVSTSLFQAALTLQHGNANVFDAVDSWKREIKDWVESEHPPLDEAAARRADRLASDRWFFNTFETADGVVTITAPRPLHGKLAAILGVEDPMLSDPSWTMPDDPRPHLAALTRKTREAVKGWRSADLIARLDADGIPCARVALPEEALLGEHAAANGFVETFDHPAVGPVTLPAAPVRFSESAYAAAHTSAAYGEHTIEVLQRIGLTEAQIDALIEAGIVGTPERSPYH
jgi:crotonobetainyl-CoA:carnitine CoA-transferase CaiB-like acyl-CoA transferase